jgi:hypothetical protein
MTSFAAAIEPAAAPRLAAAALLVHSLAAAAPWVARVDAPVAALLTLVRDRGFALSLGGLPGRHCPLAAIELDASGSVTHGFPGPGMAARGTGTWFTGLSVARGRGYPGRRPPLRMGPATRSPFPR